MGILGLGANDRQIVLTATAGQTAFSTDFPVMLPEDLTVEAKTAAATTWTLLARPADYGLTNVGQPAGCTATLAVARAAGDQVRLTGNAVMARASSVVAAGRFNSDIIDAEFDRGLIRDQELSRRVGVAETKFGAVDAAVTAAQAAQDAAEDAQDDAEAARDTILNGPYVTVPGGTGNQSLDAMARTWTGAEGVERHGLKLAVTDSVAGAGAGNASTLLDVGVTGAGRIVVNRRGGMTITALWPGMPDLIQSGLRFAVTEETGNASHVNSKMLDLENLSTGARFYIRNNGDFHFSGADQSNLVGMGRTSGGTGSLDHLIDPGSGLPSNLFRFYWETTAGPASVLRGMGTNRTGIESNATGQLILISSAKRMELERGFFGAAGNFLNTTVYIAASGDQAGWVLSNHGTSSQTDYVMAITRAQDGDVLRIGDFNGTTLTSNASVTRAGVWTMAGLIVSAANATVNGVTFGKGSGSGANNIAIGPSALGAATTASATVAIGHNAGRSITTAVSNTIVGREAGQALTSGSQNTVVGEGALYAGSTSAQNTAVGRNALLNVTNGALNTAVGHGAGAFPTTHSNTTSLGANANVSGSNQVQLGDSATTVYAYGAVQDRSDARDKADIRDTVLGLDFLLALRPVDFRWHLRDRNRRPPPERPPEPPIGDHAEIPEPLSDGERANRRRALAARRKHRALECLTEWNGKLLACGNEWRLPLLEAGRRDLAPLAPPVAQETLDLIAGEDAEELELRKREPPSAEALARLEELTAARMSRAEARERDLLEWLDALRQGTETLTGAKPEMPALSGKSTGHLRDEQADAAEEAALDEDEALAPERWRGRQARRDRRDGFRRADNTRDPGWRAARKHWREVLLPAWEAKMAAWLAENQLGAITEKDPATKGRRFHHGLIAQEVKQVTEVIGVDFGGYQDHAIAGGDDVLSLGYTEFIGPIIKAIQELAADNRALAADNRALAARIDRLEGR